MVSRQREGKAARLVAAAQRKRRIVRCRQTVNEALFGRTAVRVWPGVATKPMRPARQLRSADQQFHLRRHAAGADIGPDRLDLVRVQHILPRRHGFLAIEHAIEEARAVVMRELAQIERRISRD